MELVRHLFTWGTSVEIVGPEQLRELMIAELESTLIRHRDYGRRPDVRCPTGSHPRRARSRPRGFRSTSICGRPTCSIANSSCRSWVASGSRASSRGPSQRLLSTRNWRASDRTRRSPRPSVMASRRSRASLSTSADSDQATRSRRILGSRAFGRDDQSEVWSFQRLRQATNYVRNTHRQAATRAHSSRRWPGVRARPRFDLLELEPVGRALADAFLDQRVGKGGTSLRKWLIGWLDGDRDVSGWPKTLRQGALA